MAKQGKKGVITADKRIAALFKVSHAIVQAFALVQKKRLAKDKVEGLADFEQGIELFKEVLKSWLIKCVRTPVSTILKAEEPLDFTNTFLEADRQNRFMQLQIRVNTIFSNLILNANDKSF